MNGTDNNLNSYIPRGWTDHPCGHTVISIAVAFNENIGCLYNQYRCSVIVGLVFKCITTCS